MAKADKHDIPSVCPITGEEMFVSELASESGSVTIRGRFKLPRVARLDAEQAAFLEVFLRSRGVISTMERELGLSYPTVRSRLDNLLESLALVPIKDEKKRDKDADAKRKILQDLEDGKISAAEAKARLTGSKQ